MARLGGTRVSLPLLLISATLPTLHFAAVWSDELEDDVEKLPPDNEDMLETSDVLVPVLTIAMLSSSILLVSALSFVDDLAIGGIILVSAAAAVLLLRVGATLFVLVDEL